MYKNSVKLVFFFKICSYTIVTPVYIYYINKTYYVYNTRNSENYSIPNCRFQLYKCSFIPTVVNEWNALYVDTRQCDSIRIFEKQLAAYFAYNNCNTTAHKSRPAFYSYKHCSY